MRFRIERSSRETPPVEGAEKVEAPNKTIDGKDNPLEIWVVEVESLDELLELVDDEGDVIVGRSVYESDTYGGPEYDLEIYDDYRE